MKHSGIQMLKWEGILYLIEIKAGKISKTNKGHKIQI